ncbi:unnamed protein product [Calypogeia fissa]
MDKGKRIAKREEEAQGELDNSAKSDFTWSDLTVGPWGHPANEAFGSVCVVRGEITGLMTVSGLSVGESVRSDIVFRAGRPTAAAEDLQRRSSRAEQRKSTTASGRGRKWKGTEEHLLTGH